MEIKPPTSILERTQGIHQEYPPAFWVLMTGNFIDRLDTNLIIPFLALQLAHCTVAGSSGRGRDHGSF